MKRLALVAAVLLFGLAAAAFTRGGWAVVTIKNPPDYLLVGTPNELTFEIRPHGRAAASGFNSVIQARNGTRRVTGRTWETSKAGVYGASIEIPTAGDWRVAITTNFGESRAQTLPWRAIVPGQRVSPLAEAERGRQLFAARGCVSCHVHRAVDVEGQNKTFGPDLSQHRLPAQYLAQFLADPSIKPATPQRMQMPNLALSTREITALVAFLST
ncbi:MAG: c-type cytochrome, partial [Gemmatimonadaceae bacterium]